MKSRRVRPAKMWNPWDGFWMFGTTGKDTFPVLTTWKAHSSDRPTPTGPKSWEVGAVQLDLRHRSLAENMNRRHNGAQFQVAGIEARCQGPETESNRR